jgi:hypothetical protein
VLLLLYCITCLWLQLHSSVFCFSIFCSSLSSIKVLFYLLRFFIPYNYLLLHLFDFILGLGSSSIGVLARGLLQTRNMLCTGSFLLFDGITNVSYFYYEGRTKGFFLVFFSFYYFFLRRLFFYFAGITHFFITYFTTLAKMRKA